MKKKTKPKKQDGRIILRSFITVKGKRIYARDYGKRAFPIKVKD